MRKVIIGVVGVLVLGAASVALADFDAEGGQSKVWDRRGDVLGEVLADLVSDGTITQAQSDAVVAAVEAKKSEIADVRAAFREQFDAAWEDGILTSEELAELPFGDRILDSEALSEALSDGEITRDEVDALRPGWKGGSFHGRLAERRGHFGIEHAEVWEDGVVTSEELAELPFGDRILDSEALTEALSDGQITKEEAKALHPGGERRGHKGFGGRR